MSAITVAGDTSGSVTLQAPAVAGSTVLTLPAITGIVGILNSATAQASTSGTSIDFTGIPSGVRRITVMFNGVSTTGVSAVLIQIGSGSVTSTGYVSVGTGYGAATVASTNYTTGFGIEDAGTATWARWGSFILVSNGNSWVISGSNARTTQQQSLTSGGITLSSTLDRVRITTVNGTDLFDAGSINIMYE